MGHVQKVADANMETMTRVEQNMARLLERVQKLKARARQLDALEALMPRKP